MIMTAKKVRGGGSDSSTYIIGLPDVDESDGERELTNLNWLLRNQNVKWPEIIDGNSNDEDISSNITPSVRKRMIVATSEVSNINICTDQTEQSKINKQKKKEVITSNTNEVTYSASRKLSSAASLKRLSPTERFEIFINKIKRDLTEYEKSSTKYKTDVTEKPPFNYSHIIGMAMLEYGRATLQQICAWIESKFAFFRVRKKWNNSIRHNLSLHYCFRNRKREEKGKGGYWELGVDPRKCDRKRIRNRKSGQPKLMSSLPLAKDNPHKTQNIIDCNQKDEYIQMCLHGHSYNYMADEKIEKLNEVERQVCTLKEGDTTALKLSTSNTERQNHGRPFLCSNEFPLSINAEDLQQQYERGTIIIRTSDDSLCLNDIFINNKFNNINMIYTQEEIPTLNESVIISSHMSTILDANEDTPIIPVISGPAIPRTLTTNCDYSSFRTYIDGEDESFNYIQSSEINRNEDILCNLMDACVHNY